MALISTKTILTSLSLFHMTLAYFFFTSPSTIADQAMVWVLGESMGMVSLFSIILLMNDLRIHPLDLGSVKPTDTSLVLSRLGTAPQAQQHSDKPHLLPVANSRPPSP